MTEGIHRRQFLRQMTTVFGLVSAGSSVAWAGSEPPAPRLRRTATGDLLETVPKGELPAFAKQGGPKVQEAYRYAADNGEILRYIPCFCGCTNIGHRHNADCYVAARLSEGRITFTSHGAT